MDLLSAARVLTEVASLTELPPPPPGAPAITPNVAALVAQFAPHDCPVVITGPIGVGKSYVANLLHQQSKRSGDFVPVPLTSLQAGFEHVTLAGHDKGAYTGAHQRRRGLLEEAHRGTLFLDEIGDASVEGQRLLLELLTERGLRRLGEERRIRYDLRFILATHVDLDRATTDGRFREDLLSRLGHCWIRIPALRERSEEIPPLVAHFLGRLAGDRKRPAPVLSPELSAALAAAPWTYNVRGLASECQSLYTAGSESGEITLRHLSPRFWREVTAYARTMPDDRARAAFALTMKGGVRTEAAEFLGMSLRTFHRRIADPEVIRPRGRPRLVSRSSTDGDQMPNSSTDRNVAFS
jgi:DNA-binding NtrC family response regulator